MKTALLPFLNSNVGSPQSLDEAFCFLMRTYCNRFEETFHQSLLILIEKLHLVSFDQFQLLNNAILLHLFSSSNFKIPNEDSLLQLIESLIIQDSKRKVLLNAVRYPYVSSALMNHIFKDYSIHDLDQ
jgi:hypothetical protein